MVDHPHVQYSVGHTTKSMEPDGRGGFHEVFTVNYTSPSGVQSYVKVPAARYTPREVHNVIQHEVDRIEGVQALQPGVPVPAHDPTP